MIKSFLKTWSLLLLICALSLTATAQKEAYAIFDKNGKSVKYDKMLKQLQEADVVLFGELHNNSICHWLEFEVAKDLYGAVGNKLVLGAEMFETDDQIILNEYLSGTIKHKHLTAEAKMWNNYSTDYKPLIEFAKENKLKFVATNIPRRYANLIARKGKAELANLSTEAKLYMMPLPLNVNMELKCYKMFIEMDMGHGEQTPPQMAEAQASKDATMAHFITKNRTEGQLFVHYNGAYHSDNFESIYYYLKQANPNLKIVTISTTEQENVDSLNEEEKGKADFIITTPESITKTY